MIAIAEKAEAVVVISIPLEVINRYREALSSEGTQSDTLGAIQHLFGLSGDYFVSGSKQQWDAVTQLILDAEGLPFSSVRPSVEALTRLTVTHAELLSKSEAIDTLGTLVRVQTEAKDIQDALNAIGKAEVLIRVYDTERFLPEDIAPQTLVKWMNHWTELVLLEAKQNRGENIHD